MADYIVTNTRYGANFRAGPSTSATKLGNFRFGTPLSLVDDTGTKWKVVEDEDGQRGYVSDVNLTVPRSDGITRLIASVAYYWDLFDRGRGKEDVLPYKNYVLKMWDDLGGGRPPGNNTSHPDWPWSAAGISAFVRRAGGYSGFIFASAHARFIHDAIVQRNAENTDAPFWAYRVEDPPGLNERPPEVGDLVVQWRKRKIDYDHAAGTNEFSSHSDVVSEIRDGYLWAIGANVGPHSVARKKYDLDSKGFLRTSRRVIALLSNRSK